MSTCNKCRFAKAEDGRLFCHRAPPSTVVSSSDSVSFLFPAVHPSSWCGEFKLALKRLFRGHVVS